MREMGVTADKLLGLIASVRPYKNIKTQEPEKDAVTQTYPILREFARDLTEAAALNQLDPFIGRQDEIRRMITVLSRRNKNNPVLVGDTGVGKNAIVEGLAQRIVRGEVPEQLKGKKIFALDAAALLSGAKAQGDFQARLRSVIKEIADSNGEIILYIDQVHTMVSLGGTGGMDASSLMTEPLARGQLRCIGTTTYNDQKKVMEKNKSFETAFQPIEVVEPSGTDCVAILRGLKRKYEMHHGVRIKDRALEAAVMLSKRYITDRQLPDKAIDIIDEAAAGLRIRMSSKPVELDNLERDKLNIKIEIESLKKESDASQVSKRERLQSQLEEIESKAADVEGRWMLQQAAMKEIGEVKEAIEKCDQEIDDSKRRDDLEHVATLVKETKPKLEEKLKTLQARDDLRDTHDDVDLEEVSAVVSRWSGIPVDRMLKGEAEKLLKLEEHLGKRVVGQDEALGR